MSKATIQVGFGGKKIGAGNCTEGHTPEKLQAFVNSQSTKDNTVTISKEQPTR